MPQDIDQHQRMTERRKAGFEKKQARATQTKGLLIVHTGNGKGKSTAAWGMILRCLGHGQRVGIVQFIKGALHSAERDFLQQSDLCDFVTAGEGYTWETQDRDADETAARHGWEQAMTMIHDERYSLIVLDEINVVLKYGYLGLEDILSDLAQRPDAMHVVLTGRNAPAALIDAADLVTEMKLIKHPYKEQGIRAQAGIEY